MITTKIYSNYFKISPPTWKNSDWKLDYLTAIALSLQSNVEQKISHKNLKTVSSSCCFGPISTEYV